MTNLPIIYAAEEAKAETQNNASRVPAKGRTAGKALHPVGVASAVMRL